MLTAAGEGSASKAVGSNLVAFIGETGFDQPLLLKNLAPLPSVTFTRARF